MQITKNNLRSLIREMIKQEKGIIKENAQTQYLGNGKRYTVADGQRFRFVKPKGFTNVEFKKHQLKKGIISVQVTTTGSNTKNQKDMSSLGVNIIDNTAEGGDGTITITPPIPTIKRISNQYGTNAGEGGYGKFGKISQSIVVYVPQWVRLNESKKSKGGVLKEEVIQGTARVSAKGIKNVFLRGFSESTWSQLKPKTSAQAQDSKQNPVIQFKLSGKAETIIDGSDMTVQGIGSVQVLTPAYQRVHISDDVQQKKGNVKTIGTRVGDGEFY